MATTASDRAEADLKADYEKRLTEANRHAHDLELALADQRKKAEVTRVDAEVGPPDGPDSRGGPRGRGVDMFAMLANNPEAAKLFAIQQRGQLDLMYGALFKKLNLSAADLAKFKNLLLEKQNAARDVLSAARAQGLNPRQNGQEIGTLIAQANSEVDNSIRAAIGDAAFSQYQQFEQTAPQRNLVSQLDQRLSNTSNPLNEAQSNQLIDLLAANSAASGNGNVGFGPPGGPGSRGARITDEAIVSSQAVLAPDQVAMLQQIQTEQQAQQKLFQLMRNPGTGTSPGNGVSVSAPTAPPPRPPSG
jgi:hypothetical protein